jgi:hypothetical protein
MTANKPLARIREHVDPHWGVHKVERELFKLEEQTGARRSQRLALFAPLAFAGAAAAWLLMLPDPQPQQTASRVVAPISAPVTAPVVSAPGVPPEAPEAAPTLAVAEPQVADETEAVIEDDATDTDEPEQTTPRRGRLRHHKRMQSHHSSTRVVVAGEEWRSLAREGRFGEAYRVLSQTDLAEPLSAVDDLLLAGDAARLSGHPKEAVPYYRDALARAGTGSRAHLAGLTLGRTLLHQIGDAQGAAQAFARAYAAAPHGPLAEEALAGEVEAWARAGDRQRTQESAQKYMAAFPHGRRVRDVERFGATP